MLTHFLCNSAPENYELFSVLTLDHEVVNAENMKDWFMDLDWGKKKEIKLPIEI